MFTIYKFRSGLIVKQRVRVLLTLTLKGHIPPPLAVCPHARRPRGRRRAGSRARRTPRRSPPAGKVVIPLLFYGVSP
ncbi:hypothetical protein BpHYR1_011640 [Brachionus plicatilis]|uniref:Uncharacterized protein n=1 Tax=Brachionus plicatilis TaxID=10195 RepID=A0A3M7RTS5_BRAPC|nr:hypothetical protein BpHYR1_011640 [Brachionus plicatilis]